MLGIAWEALGIKIVVGACLGLSTNQGLVMVYNLL